MLAWIARGLRNGIVTTRYPRRPEPAPEVFRGRVEAIAGGSADLERLCPTAAIEVHEGVVTVDRRRCILCGSCVASAPQVFRFVPEYETAFPGEDETRRALGDRVRALRRSLHIRHVDTGSDGAEEWEIAALTNPYYDVQRLGIFFTAAPRHADILLVTGGVTQAMAEPLRRAWEVMPEPKAVVAAGTDACTGGFAAATGEVMGGVDRMLPVDVYVPGSPPSPIALLHGLLLAVGGLVEEGA
jgi:Ni,Fe-hydrogenase III small subunit/ferredoxin